LMRAPYTQELIFSCKPSRGAPFANCSGGVKDTLNFREIW
jgi:hypothetical protein